MRTEKGGPISHRFRRPFVAIICLAAAVLVLCRLILYLSIQYPAPTGDGILFASVAHYHCATGVFSTPIFPLDPSGLDRYVWHAIGHPALLSALNVDCSNAGAFAALSLILLATFVISGLAVARARGAFAGLLFAVVVFALQVKQDFRPETTAMLLVLIAEWLRLREREATWLLATSLLAWVHPTTLILYVAYAVLSTDRLELRAVVSSSKSWLPTMVLLQGVCVFAYPFPIADLLQGMATQGRSFAARSDGDLFTYFVRSDFFPLLGAALVVTYGFSVRANWKLLGLVPLVWLYGVRVPPAYYNLIPLFTVLLMRLLIRPTRPNGQGPFQPREPGGMRTVLVATSVLALLGLLQANLRDLSSHLRHGASLAAAQARYDSLMSFDSIPCRVPPFFTLSQPREYFESSYRPTAKACGGPNIGQRWDFFPPTRPPSALSTYVDCLRWPEDHPTRVGAFARLFRSDSGYSFMACRLQDPR